MYIEEIKEKEGEAIDLENSVDASEVKKVLVGAGGRLLFYPTLVYNLVRFSFESEFRWWDRVDQVHRFLMSKS